MKTIIKMSFLLLAITSLGWTFQQGGNPVHNLGNKQQATPPVLQMPDKPAYFQGVITIKLKPGLGDFGKQTGSVQFGIPTLDEKIAEFGVYQLDKRFRYNPAKLRADLPDLSRIYKISFPKNFPVNEVAEAFSSDPNVEYAEPIPIGHFAEIPNDALYAQMQHLPQIHAPEAWDIHKGENGTEEIVIAINDTGVDWDHEDLQSNIWQNLAEDFDHDGHTMEYNGTQWVLDPGDLNGVDDDGNGFTDDLLGWNFVTNNGDPNPIPGNSFYDHGTHCAGIAAGSTNNGTGIASISWNVKVMGICIDSDNSIPFAYDGIIYAAENGADIISDSWYTGYNYSIAHQEVINYATGLGSIILAAAANDNCSPFPYPASYQNVISVASVSVDDTKAGYSNYNLAVDISAPGGGTEGGIWSTMPDNTYAQGSGTSMATPLIAGCLGLLKSYRPDWSNDQLITQILGTADNIDSLNPNYINRLGTGRVNAYRMLAEEDVSSFLKLELISATSDDENGNGINEPGETVTMNFSLHNYVQGLGAANVIASLSSDDPDITVLNGSAVIYIPSDSSFSIDGLLSFEVAADAHSHVAEMNIHFVSSGPILMGRDIPYQVLVAPEGIFVFEGEENGHDYSGSFITGFLDHLGYEYTYSNYLPALLGFETAFLSFGNLGPNMNKATPFTENQSLMIQQFLESGGNLYIEMGAMFYRMYSENFSNKLVMKQLFGMNSYITVNADNPVDTLYGVNGTFAEGIFFNGSDQRYNFRIDKLTPAASAVTPFYENDYGNVALANDGSAAYGHRTFYFGYALAGLHDRDEAGSRYNVLLKTMQFFDYQLPEGYILSNFLTDKTAGGQLLEVQFTDISLSDPAYPVTSWQWDFNNDGTIDSQEQNPVWIFEESGDYTIRLVTSNGLNFDTLVVENLVTVNSGYLVYEGVENGDDYSGIFIRDYLQENVYTVTYRNIFPQSLEGYSAVFLCFGNLQSGGTHLNDQMASILIDYLQNGGYVYLEGGDALGNDQVNNTSLLNMFGLIAATNGTGSNPIDELAGKPTAITHDLVFIGNSQVSNDSIDKFAPSSNGKTAFTETGYGTVAVQQNIPAGRRSFCFSYSLADLNDGDYPNTREELLKRILNFFDIYTAHPEINALNSGRLVVYPNPANDKIYITASVISGNAILSIFNTGGEKIIEKQLSDNETQIDISALPRGVYFVMVQNEKLVEVGKLVKE